MRFLRCFLYSKEKKLTFDLWFSKHSYQANTKLEWVHACPCVYTCLQRCVFDYSLRMVVFTILWDDRGPSLSWEMSLQVHSCHFSERRSRGVIYTQLNISISREQEGHHWQDFNLKFNKQYSSMNSVFLFKSTAFPLMYISIKTTMHQQ